MSSLDWSRVEKEFESWHFQSRKAQLKEKLDNLKQHKDEEYCSFLLKLYHAHKIDVIELVEQTFSEQWCSGGMSGGDCYGGGADHAREPDEPLSMDRFDAIMEMYLPNISWQTYRKIVKELVKYDTVHDSSDYYGNYTINTVRKISLWDFWVTIISNGGSHAQS